MSPRFLADAIVALHFAFVLWVVLGGLAVAWRARFAWLHLPALAWGLWIEASHGICPLTPLENHWRDLAGQAGYEGGFIEHYVMPVLYPSGLTPALQWTFAAVLVALNLVLYGWAVVRHRRRTRGPA